MCGRTMSDDDCHKWVKSMPDTANRLHLLPGTTAQAAAQFTNQAACVCFVHIPKTAGTTLMTGLANLFNPHEVMNHLPASLPATADGVKLITHHKKFADFERISGNKLYLTCLRKPLPRLLSIYRFWRALKPSWVLERMSEAVLRSRNLTFAQLLQSTDPVLVPEVDNAMVRYLSSARDDEPVTEAHFAEACATLEKIDVILIQDTLDADFSDFCGRIGAPASASQLGLHNTTDSNHLTMPDQFVPAEDLALNLDDAEFVAAVRARTQYDLRLYYAGVALRGQRQRQPAALPAVVLKAPVQLVQDEKLVDTGPEFAAVLAEGWTPPQGGGTWTMAQRATLRFDVKKTSPGGGIVRLQIFPALLPHRGRIDLTMAVKGGTRQRIVFLNAGHQLARHELDEVDLICAGGSGFSFDLPLPDTGPYEIAFELGPLMSPASIGYNTDGRILGVMLTSIKPMSRVASAIRQ
jgi:Sulfotransferase family